VAICEDSASKPLGHSPQVVGDLSAELERERTVERCAEVLEQ
jgi:hypothetical protein